MLLDDEEDARDLVATVLREEGAYVVAVGSSAAGLEALETFAPDVIVTDIGMPGEDGYAFRRRLKELAPPLSIPTVAFTAFARPEDRARALAAGFNEHIPQPVEPKPLNWPQQNWP